MEIVCVIKWPFILQNIWYFMRTKHIEIECHCVGEKIHLRDIVMKFVKSSDQLADIFTKSLTVPRISYYYNKLDTYDYAPT